MLRFRHHHEGVLTWHHHAAVARELAALAVAGSHLPAEIHALVYGLNTVLGAIGETVTFVQAEVTPAGSSLAGLAAAIKGGSVKTLVAKCSLSAAPCSLVRSVMAAPSYESSKFYARLVSTLPLKSPA